MIFELAQDYAAALAAIPPRHRRRTTLALLDEALRRDVHLIDRHPTTLFQCMWNTCWWYDCGQAESLAHFEQLAESPPPAAGRACEPKLSALLQRWKQRKQMLWPSFAWVRSWLPPRPALATGQQQVLRGCRYPINVVRFCPRGRRLISGGGHQTAYELALWDVGSGKLLHLLGGEQIVRRHFHTYTSDDDDEFNEPDFGVLDAAWSPDGNWFVWDGGGNGRPEVRHAGSFQPRLHLTDHGALILRLLYTPDGRRIVSATDDVKVRFHDAATGELLRCVDVGSGCDANAVAISPDAKLCAVAQVDRSIHVWDLAARREVARFPTTGTNPFCLAFGPDGRRLVGSGIDGAITVWDAADGTELSRLGGHGEKVNHVACSRDGSQLATVSGFFDYDESTVRIWDAADGVCTRRLVGHRQAVRCAAFCPTGDRIATGSRDRTIRIWDSRGGGDGERIQARGVRRVIRSCAFTKDGLTLLVIEGDTPWNCRARLYDTRTGKETFVIEPAPPYIDRFALSDDSALLALGDDRRTTTWGIATGRLVESHDSAAAGFDPVWVRVGASIVLNEQTWRTHFGDPPYVPIRLRSETVFRRGSPSPPPRDLSGAEAEKFLRLYTRRLSTDPQVVGWYGETFDLTAAQFTGKGWACITDHQLHMITLEGILNG